MERTVITLEKLEHKPLEGNRVKRHTDKEAFIKKLEQEVTGVGRYGDPIINANFKHIHDNIPTKSTNIYHKNYMLYLDFAWAEHKSVVISPEILWYTILCEISTLVQKNPERFRNLFTDSSEKKEISVAGYRIIPISTVISRLKEEVKFDTNIIFPSFENIIENYTHAIHTTFAEAASPYYTYSLYLCGIPEIHKWGSQEDWNLLPKAFTELCELFGFIKTNNTWYTNVLSNLKSCAKENTKLFWKDMFYLEPCGSGSQTTVSGWFSEFFIEQPSIKYATNYSTHISKITYKQLETNINYKLKSGLFSSKFVKKTTYLSHNLIML